MNGIQWCMWYLHTYFFHPVQLYLLLGWKIIILIFICLFAWLIWKYVLSLYIDIFMVCFTILLETLKEIRASFWEVLQSNNTVIERNLIFPKISEEKNEDSFIRAIIAFPMQKHLFALLLPLLTLLLCWTLNRGISGCRL